MKAEFDEIDQFLGDFTIKKMMDIGCGHGLIIPYFYKLYECQIHLVDIETTKAKHHYFNATGAGYGSLEKSKAYLGSNGVPASRVQLTNPQKTQLQDRDLDLIISLISAGFHYPIDEYAKFALESLRPGGGGANI